MACGLLSLIHTMLAQPCRCVLEHPMFVTLSMIFCLASDPTQCRTINPMVPDTEPLTMSSCPIAGQIESAKWINDHPKYELQRIQCTVGKRFKQQGA